MRQQALGLRIRLAMGSLYDEATCRLIQSDAKLAVIRRRHKNANQIGG